MTLPCGRVMLGRRPPTARKSPRPLSGPLTECTPTVRESWQSCQRGGARSRRGATAVGTGRSLMVADQRHELGAQPRLSSPRHQPARGDGPPLSPSAVAHEEGERVGPYVAVRTPSCPCAGPTASLPSSNRKRTRPMACTDSTGSTSRRRPARKPRLLRVRPTRRPASGPWITSRTSATSFTSRTVTTGRPLIWDAVISRFIARLSWRSRRRLGGAGGARRTPGRSGGARRAPRSASRQHSSRHHLPNQPGDHQPVVRAKTRWG